MPCIDQVHADQYSLYRGDCVEVLRDIPDNSIHMSVFSPPFSSLFTYSDHPADMGNTRGDDEFFAQYRYLADELHRVMMPGRVVCVHCMDLPATKARHGYIGMRDFPGEIVRVMEAAGFIYHSRVTIWKDPVTAMQRTKAIGLLYRQLRKDSALSRQGMPDYLLMFRAAGDNPEPVTHTYEQFPVAADQNPNGAGWQQYASPCWTGEDETLDDSRIAPGDRYADPIWWDINQTDTLQYMSAREHNDERHICPLQIPVITRCIDLWSNPGDTVLTPFLGIGSEAYTAVRLGRRAVGVELKGSYFRQAKGNLESVAAQAGLFG